MTKLELEKEWAKYKYWVMSRSQKAYNELREMFKDNKEVDEKEFYKIINEIEYVYDHKAEANAFEHVWGYFKKVINQEERDQYLYLLQKFRQTDYSIPMYEFLYSLTLKYNVEYLLESYYFKGLDIF